MNHPTCSSPLRLFAGAALLFIAGLAQAQYVWIDAKGIRQYSDRPPPPSTPPVKIIKSPQPMSLLAEAPGTPAPAADADAQKKRGPLTLAERELDYRKRQQERAQQDQKAAEEAQRKQALAENCTSARQYKAQLDSGIRMAEAGADGERTYISDEERAKRMAKANRVLEGCR